MGFLQGSRRVTDLPLVVGFDEEQGVVEWGRLPIVTGTIGGGPEATMIFAGTQPDDWVFSTLLVLAWLALWASRRGVPWWCYVVGLGLTVLCYPVGLIAADNDLQDGGCSVRDHCLSGIPVDWWANGYLGLITLLGLIFADAIIAGIRLGVKRSTD